MNNPVLSARALRDLALGATLALCTGTADARPEVGFFGGLMTDNPWEEIVFLPWKIDLQKPGLVGVLFSQPFGSGFDTRAGPVSLAIEGQVVGHFYLQRNWEFNLPVTARLHFDRRLLGLIDSAAAGIGPSRADRPPSFERQRGEGDVERGMVYWFYEVARVPAGRPGATVFLRLHHRSDSYGLAGKGGTSNALVLGYRWGL